MMRPVSWVQGALASVGCTVLSQLPSTVPEEFILQTVTGNVPVSNGRAQDSMDVVLAVAVVAASKDRAWELANRVTAILESAYELGVSGPAYFETQMLPVKQPQVEAVSAQGAHQYNAVYRLIFSA